MSDEIAGPPIRGEAGIAGLVPFGLGTDQPRHYQQALSSAWENRDRLGYALAILRHGVCDGCSLGPAGLRDDVLPGPHLCTKRLAQLRSHTIGPLTPSDLASIKRLRLLSSNELHALGRLPFPFVYRPGDRGFNRISWDEALDLAGGALRDTEPDRTAWLATGRGLTNEAYYAFAKAARLYGSNHVGFSNAHCYGAAAQGLSEVIGCDAATGSFTDWLGADLLLLWGANLARNQPVALRYLAEAKRRGARIIAIDTGPLPNMAATYLPTEPLSALFGTRILDDLITIQPGGDHALVQAVIKTLIRSDAVDHAFIEAHTTGWEAYTAKLSATHSRSLCTRAGVSMSQVEWLAQLVARSRNLVSIWSNGDGRSIAHLHLSQGTLHKPNNGLFPLRAPSGFYGGSACGVDPQRFPGDRPIDEASAQRMEKLWGEPVPAWPGKDTDALLRAARSGELDVLYQMGGNLGQHEAALGRIGLRIHQDIHLNPGALVEPGEAILLLPAQTRYEQRGGGTVTSAERRIRFSPEVEGHPIIGSSRPEFEIPARVVAAARPALEPSLLFRSSQAIRDEIGLVVPRYAGIENLRAEGDWIQWGGPQLSPDRKARFSVEEPR